MSQNIYDRADFFKAYSEIIDRSHSDLTDDVMWKRLHKLLPKDEELRGMDILDLGCGSGWFCRWVAEKGAKRVLGIDLSQNMLAKARELSVGGGHSRSGTSPDAGGAGSSDGSKVEEGRQSRVKYEDVIVYKRADLDDVTELEAQLQLPGEDTASFDLVFSALALHYLVNLEALVALIHRVLKPGGLFVLNVEHPIYTAPSNPRVVRDLESGEKFWSLNNYHKEGERVVNWLAPGLRKQHRTVTTYVTTFLEAGFEVTGFAEWLPTEEELNVGLVDEEEALRPLFLMMSVRK